MPSFVFVFVFAFVVAISSFAFVLSYAEKLCEAGVSLGTNVFVDRS